MNVVTVVKVVKVVIAVKVVKEMKPAHPSALPLWERMPRTPGRGGPPQPAGGRA